MGRCDVHFWLQVPSEEFSGLALHAGAGASGNDVLSHRRSSLLVTYRANHSNAAEALGIGRTTWRKHKEYGIDR